MAEDLPHNDRAAERVYFDAVLYPHRSLSPRGFLLFMAALAAISFTAGMVFLMRGAWPVFGFFGLDAALIYLAFRQNYRDARLHEQIILTAGALVIRRIEANGVERSWSFEPYWVRVDLEETGHGSNRLTVSSHGRVILIGGFLTPAEREELAHALQGALRDHAGARAGG